VLFNEPKLLKFRCVILKILRLTISFSALQRAEIAEINLATYTYNQAGQVSVLFNEPKLLKCFCSAMNIQTE